MRASCGSGTEEHVVIESTVDRVRGEHTTHELFFLFVGYLYLCNNSAVKCVPCTVPHFIVHKDTKMISPKTTNMSCRYRYITHFNLFHRLAFFVVQHIKRLSWHMPYATSPPISSTFLWLLIKVLLIFQAVSRSEEINQMWQTRTNEQYHHHLCCSVEKRTLLQI